MGDPNVEKLPVWNAEGSKSLMHPQAGESGA